MSGGGTGAWAWNGLTPCSESSPTKPVSLPGPQRRPAFLWPHLFYGGGVRR